MYPAASGTSTGMHTLLWASRFSLPEAGLIQQTNTPGYSSLALTRLTMASESA